MKLHESMFPIVINSVANSLVTFTSPTDGVWGDGRKACGHHNLEYFLSRAISHPDSHIVESVGGHKFPITFYCGDDCGLITFDSFNNGVWHETKNTPEEKSGLSITHFFEVGYKIMNNSIESIVGDIVIEPTYQECAIEDMPLGAKLLGYYNTDGEFVELTFRPRVIEVHDNCICLLMHFHHKGDGVDGEASFLRNRKIRYEK